jgi:hypothetical protein
MKILYDGDYGDDQENDEMVRVKIIIITMDTRGKCLRMRAYQNVFLEFKRVLV